MHTCVNLVYHKDLSSCEQAAQAIYRALKVNTKDIKDIGDVFIHHQNFPQKKIYTGGRSHSSSKDEGVSSMV